MLTPSAPSAPSAPNIPGISVFNQAPTDAAAEPDVTQPRKNLDNKSGQRQQAIQENASKFLGQQFQSRMKQLHKRADRKTSDSDQQASGSTSSDKAYGALRRVLAKKPDIKYADLPPQLQEACRKLTKRRALSPKASLNRMLADVRLIGPADSQLESSGVVLSDESTHILETLNTQCETTIRRIHEALKQKKHLSPQSDIVYLNNEVVKEVCEHFDGGILEADLSFTPISSPMEKINKAGQYGITIAQAIATMGQIISVTGNVHGAVNIDATHALSKKLGLVVIKSFHCPIQHYDVAFYVQYVRAQQQSLTSGFYTILDQRRNRMTFERHYPTYMEHDEINALIQRWQDTLQTLTSVTNPWTTPDYTDDFYISDLTQGLVKQLARDLGIVPDYESMTIREAKLRLESAIGFLLQFRRQSEVARLIHPEKLTGSYFQDCHYELNKNDISLDHSFLGECVFVVQGDEWTYSDLLTTPSPFSYLHIEDQMELISRALVFERYAPLSQLLMALNRSPASPLTGIGVLNSHFSIQGLIQGMVLAMLGNNIEWSALQALRKHLSQCESTLGLLDEAIHKQGLSEPQVWLTVEHEGTPITYGEATRSHDVFYSIKKMDRLRILAWALQLGHFSRVANLLVGTGDGSDDPFTSRNDTEKKIGLLKVLQSMKAILDSHIHTLGQAIKNEHSIVSYQQYCDFFGISGSVFHDKTAFGKL